jgi:hypothetical protein
VPLAAYRPFAADDLLGPVVLEQMLAGVATLDRQGRVRDTTGIQVCYESRPRQTDGSTVRTSGSDISNVLAVGFGLDHAGLYRNSAVVAEAKAAPDDRLLIASKSPMSGSAAAVSQLTTGSHLAVGCRAGVWSLGIRQIMDTACRRMGDRPQSQLTSVVLPSSATEPYTWTSKPIQSGTAEHCCISLPDQIRGGK